MIDSRSAEEAALGRPSPRRSAGEGSPAPREIPVVADGAAAAANGARQAIARLADDLLPVLIARLEASALGELEVRENGWRIRLRRPAQHNGRATGDEASAEGRTSDSPRAPASPAHASSAPADGRSPLGRSERQRAQATSPAVGYFVPRDNVGPGSNLRHGDVIGYVDVLGVRQEVVAPLDGILARLEVEPGQAVEYGQPIARLDPDTRDSGSESRR